MEVQLRDKLLTMTDSELVELKKNRIKDVPTPLKGEVWKTIPDTYGMYQVSNKGRFRKIWTTKRGISRTDILSIIYASSGLAIISYMTNKGIRVKKNLSHVVWELFGKTPALNIIYKDGNRKNCRFENLLSVDDSQYQSYISSLTSKKRSNITKEEKEVIYKLESLNFSQNEIAKIFNVSQSLISRICKQSFHNNHGMMVKDSDLHTSG